jgi:short-subunit dehydrogenase
VVISSVGGHQVTYWEPVSSASKHAVHALTHGIRRQLIGTGVRIGSVAPGVVLNGMWKVTDAAAVEAGVAAGTGVWSEDVADAVLTRPSHVNIRDLVILPSTRRSETGADRSPRDLHLAARPTILQQLFVDTSSGTVLCCSSSGPDQPGFAQG